MPYAYGHDLPHCTGPQSVRHCNSSVHVLGDHGCRQTVHCIVGTLYDFLSRLELHYLLNWTKNLKKSFFYLL